MLKINNLHFEFDKLPLFQGLNLSVSSGEIITLLGSSGCGKSTLLRLINGLESPLKGTICINNFSPSQAKDTIAYMTQDDLLLPWRTALKNAALPLEIRGKSTKNAQSLLEELGLSGFEHCYPHELSGGMKQRVALARTLVEEKPLLLLDEPFSSLDVALREQLYSKLRSIRDRLGTTIILVTHDFHDALSLSDRIFHIQYQKADQMWSVAENIRNTPEFYGSLTHQIRAAFLNTTPIHSKVKA